MSFHPQDTIWILHCKSIPPQEKFNSAIDVALHALQLKWERKTGDDVVKRTVSLNNGMTTLSLKILRHYSIHFTMIYSHIIFSLWRISEMSSLLHRSRIRRCGVDLRTSIVRWCRRSSILEDTVGADRDTVGTDRKYTLWHYVSCIWTLASTGGKKKSGQHTLDRPSLFLKWISSIVLLFTIDSPKFVW